MRISKSGHGRPLSIITFVGIQQVFRGTHELVYGGRRTHRVCFVMPVSSLALCEKNSSTSGWRSSSSSLAEDAWMLDCSRPRLRRFLRHPGAVFGHHHANAVPIGK
jgi:hypothetical protein